MRTARAFVAIGSNINPLVNVRAAIRTLASQVQVIAVSTVYCTEPERRPNQSAFYNCVVEIQTEIDPQSLKFQVLRRIEADLGRHRTVDKDAPRTIDLDLILYDDLVLNARGLVLPDPEIASRPFILIPLTELSPDLVLPGTSTPIAELAAGLSRGKIRPLSAYTEQLRQEIRVESSRFSACVTLV